MLPGNSRAKSHSPTSQTRPQETSIIPHSVNIPTHTLLQRSAHTGQNPAASCTSLSLSHIPQRMPGHSVSSASSTTPACRRIKAQAAPPHPCFQTRWPLPDPQGGNKNLATVRACVSPAAKAHTHTPAPHKQPGHNSPTALSRHATTTQRRGGYSVPTPVSQARPSASAPSCAADPAAASAAARTAAPAPAAAAAAAGPVPA